MRHRFLAPFALALLLVTAGCLGQPTTLAAPGDTDADAERRTITVSASGDATHAPDVALVQVTVQAAAEDAAAARDRVATDAAAVRKALRDAGIAADDLRTVRYAIHPDYDRGDRSTVTGYRAVHTFEVTVQDPDDAGRVVDTAVTAGADTVDGVRFTLSDDARQTVRERAIEDAMANARGDATATAQAAAVTLGPVHSATVASQSPLYGRVTYAVASDSGAPTRFDSGPVTVTVRVTVTYQVA